jgi:hypothetical protein
MVTLWFEPVVLKVTLQNAFRSPIFRPLVWFFLSLNVRNYTCRIEELYDAGAPRAKLFKARAVIRMTIKSLVMVWFVKWLKSIEYEARSTQRVRGVLDRIREVRPAEELAPKEALLILVKSAPQPPVGHRKETFLLAMANSVRRSSWELIVNPTGYTSWYRKKTHFTSTALGGLHTNE